MALVSPGVEVSVIDESQYSPTTASTVPLVVLATASNKETSQGTLAEGTLTANAGDLYVLTSQRDVLNFFGTPSFYTDTNNTPIHGYELNEYGLQTVYSLLGSTSRCYVLRADIDLGQLIGLSSRPQANPADMTYWLDTTPTRWGMFQWDSYNQEFYAINPLVITDATDLSGGVPKASIGSVGSYAVVGTNAALPVYQKNRSNDWVLVGSTDWMNSIPAVYSGYVNPTVVSSQSIDINGTTVTMTGTTLTTVASDIVGASITGITAEVVSGRLEIYIDSTAASDGSNADGAMAISDDVGTVLDALGIVADTYFRPAVQQSAHTSVPTWKATDSNPRPSLSVWVKTSAVNYGASFSVKRYNSLIGNWQLLSAPLYASDAAANKAFDPLRGGTGIPVGTTYVQYDVQAASTVTYKVFDRLRTGVTAVSGTNVSPALVINHTFTIAFSYPGYDTLTATTTITLTGTTATSMVEDILAAGLSYVGAQVEATGEVTIYHTAGGIIHLKDTFGTPLADAGITSANDYCRAGPNSDIIVSNWGVTTITASTTAPGADPQTGTMWYWGQVGEADIMVHNGTNWVGYKNLAVDARGYNLTNTDDNGPIFSATEPTTQSDLSTLAYGDLWVDTSDLEQYPRLYRYELVGAEARWIELDTADQTTENGIVFADARFMGSSTLDVNDDDIPTISSLLTSNYLDIDAPSATLYPRGMLLFNTRRSSFNVKEFRPNYFNSIDFSGNVLPTEVNAWVSISGFRENGHAFFGRKAQRSVVAAAMRTAIDTNTEIREEQREFNLIAAPNYPELIPNMVQLNNDRKQTGFVIGDSPMRIASEGTELTNYLQNTSLEGVDSENALVTVNPYVGVWYPALLGNDLNGNSIAMPASYGVLRMMIRNDQVSYPWFAPAGVRRGIIDNASRLGYLTDAGEFITIGVRQGVRDTLYENSVNPLMQTPQTGIVAFGQKTRAVSNSALDRINISRLTAYMRLQLDKVVRQFLFEPNDKITRDEIRGVIESFCNDLIAKRALYDYLVVCDESNNTPSRIDRNELYVDIAIEPVKAIEFIYIPIRIKNTGEIGS
jgi:hypothetical protein